MKIKKLGIIAGSGTLPREAVKEAQARNLDFKVYCLKEEKVDPLCDINKKPLEIKYLSLGKFDKIIEEFTLNGISHVLISGKIHKEKIIKGINFNLKTLALLKKLKDFNDKSIFNLVSDEFQKAGISVLRQDKFYKSLVLSPGIYSARKPTRVDMENISFGMNYAKKIAALDIGQSVIVSGKLLIAVEAIEGTDETILRSSKYIKRGTGIVCKAMQKNQDTRFDVASVGPSTIECMKTSGCGILAVEANRTFVLEQEIFFKKLNSNKIIFIVI